MHKSNRIYPLHLFHSFVSFVVVQCLPNCAPTEMAQNAPFCLNIRQCSGAGTPPPLECGRGSSWAGPQFDSDRGKGIDGLESCINILQKLSNEEMES